MELTNKFISPQRYIFLQDIRTTVDPKGNTGYLRAKFIHVGFLLG
jgi:hypothetical protein